MTAPCSHGCSGDKTGLSPARSQLLPSLLMAQPIQDFPFAWPVYHMRYASPSLTTTGRLTSSSQPDALLGMRTRTGSLQVRPSSLSTKAMLCLGRQENHM